MFTRRLSAASDVSERAEDAGYSGYLQKRGQLNTALQKRYFLLHGSCITYFDSEDAARKGKANGQATVAAVGHFEAEDAPELQSVAARTFRIDAVEKNKRIVLVASTVDEKVGWLRALGKVLPSQEHSSVRQAMKQFMDIGAMAADGTPGWELVTEAKQALDDGDTAAAKLAFEAVLTSTEASARLAKVYARFEIGQLCSADGAWDEAKSHYEQALEEAPANCKRNLELERALCLRGKGMHRDADAVYKAILDSDPCCLPAFKDRAGMRISLSLWEGALHDLQMAVALDEDTPANANDRGVCLFEMGDHDGAFAQFSKALELDGAFSAAVTNRANCLREQGKLREAEEDYSRAIELEDGLNPKSFVNRAKLFRQQNDTTRALADTQRALSINPVNTLALSFLLELPVDFEKIATKTGFLLKRGQVNTALQKRYFMLHGGKLAYYESGLDAAKRSKPKGEVLIRWFGHLDEDLAEVPVGKRSVAFCVDGLEDGRRLVLLAGSVEEKLEWLRALHKTFEQQRTAHQTLRDHCQPYLDEGRPAWEAAARGMCALNEGNKAEARSAFESVPHFHEGLVTSMRQSRGERSSSLSGGEASPGSVAVTEAALAWTFAQAELGKLTAEEKRWEEALSLFGEASAAAPPEVERQLLLQRTWCHMQLGNYEPSNKVYAVLLEKDPLCQPALLDRARMRIKLGDFAPAFSDLEMACALADEDTPANANDRGVCLFEMGDHDGAFAQFSKALELDHDFGPAVTNRANCLREQGKLREAEEDYSRAIELEDAKNPKSFINRGLMLEGQTKFARALPDFKRALAIEPDNELAQAKVNELTMKLRGSGLLDDEREGKAAPGRFGSTRL